MDARTNIEISQPSRHVTEGLSRAQASSIDLTEIFKRTPDIADLKPGGRYLAADMRQVGDISLLMKTLLDNGYLDGDCITVTGRTIAEDLKSVTWDPRQDVARWAPAGAPFEVADMSRRKLKGPAGCFDREEEAAVGCPIGLLLDGDSIGIDADAPDINVKLTGAALTKRRTKWKVRETHHRSGALWKYAQQVGPALGGAVIHPSAHEKCYADI